MIKINKAEKRVYCTEYSVDVCTRTFVIRKEYSSATEEGLI